MRRLRKTRLLRVRVSVPYAVRLMDYSDDVSESPRDGDGRGQRADCHRTSCR